MTTKLKQNVQIDGQLSATTIVGDGSALTGLPAGYSNTDVDTHLNQNNPTQDYVLSWNGSDYAWVSNLGGGGITHIIEDTTPQLGGNLDAQAFDITTTGKILYSNVYATEGDLPSATTYHGMFAHVHATGAGYFAHGGNWIKLANDSQLSSYQTTAGLNGAIDTHLNQRIPTSGYVLSWDGVDYTWVSNAGGGGGGGSLNNIVEDTTPELGGNLDALTKDISNVGTLSVTNLTTTGSGSTNISAGSNIELDATNRVLVTDTPFRLAQMTTTTRDAIASPAAGDMIFNTTTTKFQGYTGSAWGDLHQGIEMSEKEYIVSLKRGVDPSNFKAEMTQSTGDANIPARSVDVANERLLSTRNTHYSLTDEEAEQLKNDSRVADVAIPPQHDDASEIGLHAVQIGDFKKTTADSGNHLNWGMRRCIESTNVYGTSTNNPSGDYTYHLDGTGVDVVIQDTGIQADHPEFFDASGSSRVQQIDWYTESGLAGTQGSNHYSDTSGHVTHCAGTAAGLRYGWAKNARVYSVNVAGLSSNSSAISITDCFDVIKGWHNNKPIDPATGYKRPTIVNMSWCYGTYS